MDSLEDLILEQYRRDEDDRVDQEWMETEAQFPTGGQGLALPPGQSRRVAADIKKGITTETPAAAAGAVPRFVRGLLGTMQNAMMAPPGSEAALDALEGWYPQWTRDFAEKATEALDTGASWGADPETVTGHLSKSGLDLAINLWLLRRAGALSAPGKLAKDAGLAQSALHAAKEGGQWGLVEFIMAGNPAAMATHTRDTIGKFLASNPKAQELFMLTMTSEDPDKDQLLAQYAAAFQTSAMGTAFSWLPGAFRSFRRFLGRAMTVEEAAQHFKIRPGDRFRQRNIPQKWQGSEPTTVREIGPVEESAIGKPAPSGGLSKEVRARLPYDVVNRLDTQVAEGSISTKEANETAEWWLKEYGRAERSGQYGTGAGASANLLYRRIAQAHASQGGTSFNQAGVDLSKGKGFAASYSGLEHRISGVAPLTEGQVKSYAARPDVAAKLKEDPQSFIGTWWDEQEKQHVLDVSKTFPEESEARTWAAANKQRALWDFGNRREIRLEGEPAPPAARVAPGTRVTDRPIQTITGKKGWVTREDQIILADSHEATAEGFAKRYGLVQGSAAYDALKRGFIRWDAQLAHQFYMETAITKEALARARRVLENAPEKKQYTVDLSGEGTTEFFQTNSKEDALKKLDYFIEHGELPPRRSRVAEYLAEGGQGQSVIHDLTQAAEEAKGRLRLKINRPQMFAGLIEPENIKDISTIGASLLARGITGKEAFVRELAKLAAVRATEAKFTPEQTESLLKRLVTQSGEIRTQSEQFFEKSIMEIAPRFKTKMKKLGDMLEAGQDRFDWYRDTAATLQRIGPKEDQKLFVGFVAALSPNQRVAPNIDEALKAFTRLRTQPDLRNINWDEVAQGLGGIIGQRQVAKRLQGAYEAVRSGKDTAFENLLDMGNPKSQKVNSFFRNLWHQIERPDEVTIDSWMFHLFGVEEQARSQSYNILREVIRQEAASRGMVPMDLQAALWAGIKRTQKPGEFKVLGDIKEYKPQHLAKKGDEPFRQILHDRIEEAIKDGLIKQGPGGRLVPVRPKEKDSREVLNEMIDKALGKQKKPKADIEPDEEVPF